MFDGLTLVDLAKINNALALRYEGVKKVTKFSSRAIAIRRLKKLLEETGEQLIRFLRPDYVKRGEAAKRFAFHEDGQLVGQFIEKCEQNGYSRRCAKQDIWYDNRKGLIGLV